MLFFCLAARNDKAVEIENNDGFGELLPYLAAKAVMQLVQLLYSRSNNLLKHYYEPKLYRPSSEARDKTS